MIVVIGPAALLTTATGAGRAVGTASEIAAAAAADGVVVEIITKIGEDGAGEELLLALGRARVGHRAVLRDPSRPTSLATDHPDQAVDDGDLVPAMIADAEAAAPHPTPSPPTAPGSAIELDLADLAMGLRYLRDFRVVVAVEPMPGGGADVVAEAAAFADASVVAIAPPGFVTPPAYASATLLEAPPDDPDGAFASLVGRYAAALDRGIEPASAFRSATTEGGWEVAGS